MEKVKIISQETKTKGDKTWFSVGLSGGRTATGWADLSAYIDKEVELEIKKVEKGGNVYWNYELPKKEKGAVLSHPKETALKCASRLMDASPDKIIEAAEAYHKWLTKE